MGSELVWVMVVIVALLAAGVQVLVQRVLGSTRTHSLQPNRATAADAQAVASAYRGEVRAAFSALAIGGGTAVLLCLIGSWWIDGYGLPYALASGVGAIVGLLVYTLCPRPSWSPADHGPAVADLLPRHTTSFARQWVFVLPLLCALALLVGLLLTGLYSATDENGLHRVFQRRSLSGWGVEGGLVTDLQYNLSSTGPFPGWYYGVPVMICTILLIAMVYWSLHRTARAARPTTAGLFGADTSLRSLRTTFVMAASSAALAFQVAGLAAFTGNVLRASHLDAVPTADLTAVPGSVPVEPGHTLALIMIVFSLAVAVVAVVLLINAFRVIAKLSSIRRDASRGLHNESVR